MRNKAYIILLVSLTLAGCAKQPTAFQPLFANSNQVQPGKEYMESYCHDPTTWEEWAPILNSNPEDDGIYTLYALRIGLCDMLAAGTIDLDRSTIIFESARQAMVDVARRNKERKHLEVGRGI